MCLTLLNTEIEVTRITIEDDMLKMVKDDFYVSPPKYDIDETILAYTPSTVKPKTPDDIRTQANLEKAMAKLREDKIKEQKLKFLMQQRVYESKKRDLIDQLNKSRMLFEEYRTTECERHKAQTENKDNMFESIYVQKICIYEMTMQRIKTLQKSIK